MSDLLDEDDAATSSKNSALREQLIGLIDMQEIKHCLIGIYTMIRLS